ncbi:hypothetical protein F5Y05DRAFT_376458 [Hypoxylon sp. FL0543]|nr:hypothetical protein F5Y05DRAFT_376458 [Hypoxylon sp. FL0543]
MIMTFSYSGVFLVLGGTSRIPVDFSYSGVLLVLGRISRTPVKKWFLFSFFFSIKVWTTAALAVSTR